MKSIIQHLRFPFSFLLMPVFLFAVCCWSGQRDFDPEHIFLLFIIMHVLVYPSSNAYNSTQDKDEGSVGMIENPLPVPGNLLYITIFLDISALLLSLIIGLETTILIFIYILASRLYSYRKIRLKKYPFTGFLVVFLCQGALVFYIVLSAIYPYFNLYDSVIGYLKPALIASLFIGSVYPLSQIYQHEQDRKDGVSTISSVLGYKGTFVFSGLQFIVAGGMVCYFFVEMNEWVSLLIFIAFQLPVISFFLYWFYLVMKDNAEANYINTMRMNIISAVCMNLCFLIIFIQQYN